MEPLQTETSSKSSISTVHLMGAWGVALVVLMWFLGAPAVQRAQEARVLETGREMLGSGFRGWMVPILNGEVRLQKPPLTYWMAAGSYKIGGVNEWAGRVPTAIMGWLTLGLTYTCGSWLFGRRAGLLGAGCLLGSYLFSKHVRLAETDTPAMLFVTLAVWAWWRGMEDKSRQAMWLNLGSVGVAGALMSKGGPAVFPVVFLAAWAVLNRRWEVAGKMWRSGAVATLLVLGLPWFMYVYFTVGMRAFTEEMRVVVSGEDHGAWFYDYFPQLFLAVMPWCAAVPLAVWEAGRKFKVDNRLQGVLVWVGAVFVPLCLTGNKQIHYLLPLIPPLMILVGWWLDKGLGRVETPSESLSKHLNGPQKTLVATMFTSLVVVPAIVVWAWVELKQVRVLDGVLAGMLLVLLGGAIWVYRRRGALMGAGVFMAGWGVMLPVILGGWYPTLQGEDDRVTARVIEGRFGEGPYCFFRGTSLSLCFSMRQAIPVLESREELEKALGERAGLVVLVPTKPGAEVVEMPGLKFVMRMGEKGHHYQVFANTTDALRHGTLAR